MIDEAELVSTDHPVFDKDPYVAISAFFNEMDCLRKVQQPIRDRWKELVASTGSAPHELGMVRLVELFRQASDELGPPEYPISGATSIPIDFTPVDPCAFFTKPFNEPC